METSQPEAVRSNRQTYSPVGDRFAFSASHQASDCLDCVKLNGELFS